MNRKAYGLWFGGVNKSKTGQIFLQNSANKSDHDYNSHINHIMNPPPQEMRT
jgi:N-acetylneuraminic acid mutarotase